MDPLTVLSLTGNLVQFIDFSVKIIVEARAAYDSGTGITTRMEFLREQLEALQALAARASQPGAAGVGTPDEMALVQLSSRAKTLAQETLELFSHLKAKNPKSKFDVMRHALKASFKKSDLERLEQKVNKCRGDVIERWTIMTSDKQSSTLAHLKKDLDDLGEANKGIIRTVNDTKTVLDIVVESTRQQVQDDSAILKVIRESIEKISQTTTETKELDAIIKRLRFDEIHQRELNIADANQHTFRWLLYDQDDESHQKSDGPNADIDLNLNTDSNTTDVVQANFKEFSGDYRQDYYESVNRDQKEKQQQTRELFLHWLRSDHKLFYISGSQAPANQL